MRSVSCPARPPALSVPAPAVACQRVGARERGRERERRSAAALAASGARLSPPLPCCRAQFPPPSSACLCYLPPAFLPSFPCSPNAPTNLQPIRSPTDNVTVPSPHRSHNVGRKRREASGRPSSHLPHPLLLPAALLPQLSPWHPQSLLSKCTIFKPIHSTMDNVMVPSSRRSYNIGWKRRETSGRPSSRLPQTMLLPTAFLLLLSQALQSLLSKCTNFEPIHSTVDNVTVPSPHCSHKIGQKPREASGRPSSTSLSLCCYLPLSFSRSPWHCNPCSPDATISYHYTTDNMIVSSPHRSLNTR